MAEADSKSLSYGSGRTTLDNPLAHITNQRTMGVFRSLGIEEQVMAEAFVEQPAGTPTPDGRDLGDRSWTRTRFDIVLAPDES